MEDITMNRQAKQCTQCGAEIYFDGICVHCQAENERDKILSLSQTEVDAMIEQICSEIERTGKLDENLSLFTMLVNFLDINTTGIAEAAFRQNLFYPCEIYKNAPSAIIKEMIDTLLEDNIDIAADHLLLCLAVHGGDDVFHTFLELEKNPRPWRKKLYVNPSFYAAYGGWTFDENGIYRKTNFDKCYPMVKGTIKEKEISPVKIGVKTNERCPHCGCQIVNLMEIDGRDFRLDFLGIDGVIKAKCCPNCLEFSDDTFCRFTIGGESELVLGETLCNENYFEDSYIDELSSNTYILGDTPVPLRYAADWEGGSSIGGFAFWIQDCEIKHCPDCGKPMQYLAQIQWDTVIEDTEGNDYIEICKDCNIITILHQQT